MRTKEQFKEYVYAKANEKRLVNKRNLLTMTRTVAAFSLLFIISGVLIYGNFINQNKAESDNAPVYGANGVKEECVNVVLDAQVIKCYSASEDGTAETALLESKSTVDFSSTNGSALINKDKALEIAQEKCTIAYNATDIYFDSVEAVWKVVFYTENALGDCQTIYVNSDGTVRLIVYGE